MMFQRQLITSIENIQRKSGVKCLYPFWSKKAKKIRKGKVQKIRVKNKKQEKESERVFVISLARARACVSLLCLEVFCARVKIRARGRARVCLLCSSRGFYAAESMRPRGDRFSKETRGEKKCAATKEKNGSFYAWEKNTFHLTSLSFVTKHVREEKEEEKSFVS